MSPENLPAGDAIKTYRYLRIGMIGAVVLLAASILIEHENVASGCWQTSISAYYYTPVRAIFVGAMIAVGLALIVIKGRSSVEDIFLNAAGLLAPVVAIAPTTDVGRCWSVPPNPLPISADGSLAGWVLSNIENNFYALLIAGAVGLVAAVVIAVVINEGMGGTVEALGVGTLVSLMVTGLALVGGAVLIAVWDDFFTRAHGYAAVSMFVFLIGAVASRAFAHRAEWRTSVHFWLYLVVAASMAFGGAAIALFRIGGEHTVFVLEAYEIVLFAVFWLIQTWEHWDEDPVAVRRAAQRPLI